MASKRGIVVIGRNEGDRLRRCLESLPSYEQIVYVDSGSSDDSVELARRFTGLIHELDPAIPFSAARARQEGFYTLIRECPDVEYVQFIDGDCEISNGWLKQATQHFEQNPKTAIVTGLITESTHDSTIFTRVSPLRWRMPLGFIHSCGGIFMVRRKAFSDVGGFNTRLLTREESDLCARIREAGHHIARIDVPMAVHESGFTSFRQWWKRALWGGYGDARSVAVTWPGRTALSRLRWYLFWPIAMPFGLVICLIGTLFTYWSIIGVILFLGGIGYQFLATCRARIKDGDSMLRSLEYSLMHLVRCFACGIGFIRYWVSPERPSTGMDPRERDSTATTELR